MNGLDWFFGLLVLVVAVVALERAARRFGFKVSPLFTLLGLITLSGLLLHHPQSSLFLPSDGLYYSDWGERIAGMWEGNGVIDKPLWPGRGIVPLLVGILEFTLGAHTFSMIAIGSVATTFSYLLLKISAQVAFGAQRLSWLPMVLFITGLPIVLYGGGILRESYFWLGCALTVLAVALYSKGRILKALGAFLVGGTVLLAIRSDLGLAIIYTVLGAVALSGLMSGMRQKNIKTALQSAITLVILLLSGPSLLDTVRPDWTPEQIEVTAMDLSRAEVATAIERPEVGTPIDPSTLSAERAEVGTPIDPSTLSAERAAWCQSAVLAKLVCEISNSLPAVLVGPFPGELFTSPLSVALSVGTGHFLLVSSLALLAFRWVPPGSHLFFTVLTLTGFATLLIIAALLTNYGIIMRFRAVSEIFLFPLALLALENLFRRGRRDFQATNSARD